MVKGYFGDGGFFGGAPLRRAGLGVAPVSAANLPDVTSDLAGDLQNQLAIGQSLADHVSAVANIAQGLGGTAAATATEALATVQDSVTTLLKNGVTVQNVDATTIGNALQAVGGVMLASSVLAPEGSFLIAVGGGIAAGACFGGPIGGAIGGFLAGAASIYTSITQPAQWTFSTPTGAGPKVLANLQSWCSHYTTQSGSPIGWRLFDWVSWNAPPPNGTRWAICTPWLWGQSVGACSPWTQNQAPPGVTPPLTEASIVAQDAPDPTNGFAEAETAILRNISPALYDVTKCFVFPSGYVPGSFTTIGVPNYAYIFALGTIFSMLMGGASDQSIASELLMQQHLHALTPGADLAPAGASSLQPLIDELLGRLPSKATIAARAGIPLPSTAAGTTAGTAVAVGAAGAAAVVAGAAAYGAATGAGALGGITGLWSKLRGLMGPMRIPRL